MDKAGIAERELGMRILPDGSARMLLWAPFAESAAVRLENRQDFPLVRQGRGYWQATIPKVSPGDRYLIVLDNGTPFPDPVSLFQPGGVHAASAVPDPAWFDHRHDCSDWKGLDLASLVIYELHTGTFSESGTFAGIAERLDYLLDLGVTALELMPVAAFPGSRNWGYDGVYPFAVQNSYGGPRGLLDLIKACHERGLAVILDVVYNHLGPEGNYLARTGPYFTEKYQTPWGGAINLDDAWCDGVRRYFMENALMWLRDYRIDGLRLDALHAIKDFGARHFLVELSERVAALNRQTGHQHFLIGECDLNDVKYITSRDCGGYGVDAQWSDEFHHAVHAAATGESKGYYEDFGDLSHIVRALNHGYVYCGRYSRHRKKIFGSEPAGMGGDKFVVFAQNHDQIGNRMKGDRLSSMLDAATVRLVAGTVLVSPFVPLLFMGEEYGEDAPFLYFISHGDEELVKAVREGRRQEFSYFHEAEPPDPQSPQTFKASKLKWNFDKVREKAQLLAYYQALIRLKKEHPALRPGNRLGAMAHLSECGRAIFMRFRHGNGSSALTAVLNYADERIDVGVAEEIAAGLHPLLYSGHAQWGGTENAMPKMPSETGKISLARKSMLVLA